MLRGLARGPRSSHMLPAAAAPNARAALVASLPAAPWHLSLLTPATDTAAMQVADFGLARSLLHPTGSGDAENAEGGGASTDVLTDYVATRWYRAPEILAGSSSYSQPVDMWSLGCILGEMLGGKPVFSGSSTLNQFEKIIVDLGFPSEDDIEGLQSTFIKGMLDGLQITDEQRVSKSEERQKEAWAQMYPNADAHAIDLMAQLMKFNPDKRLKAKAGLMHPYCSQFHDAGSDVLAKQTVTVEVTKPSDDGQSDTKILVHDNHKGSTSYYRDLLYHMSRTIYNDRK